MDVHLSVCAVAENRHCRNFVSRSHRIHTTRQQVSVHNNLWWVGRESREREYPPVRRIRWRGKTATYYPWSAYLKSTVGILSITIFVADYNSIGYGNCKPTKEKRKRVYFWSTISSCRNRHCSNSIKPNDEHAKVDSDVLRSTDSFSQLQYCTRCPGLFRRVKE